MGSTTKHYLSYVALWSNVIVFYVQVLRCPATRTSIFRFAMHTAPIFTTPTGHVVLQHFLHICAVFHVPCSHVHQPGYENFPSAMNESCGL